MIKKILNIAIICLIGLTFLALGMSIAHLYEIENTSTNPIFSATSEKIKFMEDMQIIEPSHEANKKKKPSKDFKLPDGVEIIIPPERPSPQSRIKEDQIKIFPDKIVIYIKGARWATFADTNSMDPVFDAGHHGIQIVPKSPNEIQTGDIISYDSDFGPIIHRVVETGFDEEGWFAIVKGDNNEIRDPWKVRFDQVRRVLVALTY